MKDYIKRHKSEPSQRKFANFHFLVYIAELFDIDTAMTIAHKVAKEEPLDPALVELLESIWGISIFGNYISSRN